MNIVKAELEWTVGTVTSIEIDELPCGHQVETVDYPHPDDVRGRSRTMHYTKEEFRKVLEDHYTFYRMGLQMLGEMA